MLRRGFRGGLIEPAFGSKGIVMCGRAVFGVVLFFSAATASAEPTSLFDGKTLKGWEGETEKTWRVEEGAIVGGSLEETVPRNEFLATEREYGDFELTLKYKLVGTEGFVNGGVQFRSQRIPNHHEVIGYQADLGMGFDGALYDESRRRKMLAQPSAEVLAKALKKEDWNEYRIRAEGPRVRLWLNGVPTVDYTEADAEIPRTGIIALQIHGGCKAVVSYKDVVIEELSGGSKEESGEWVSLFNGKDLEGWTPKIRNSAYGENFGNTFRVEDGLLKVGYDGYDEFGERFGHLFYKEKFSNYRLRVEYRWGGGGGGGGGGGAVRNSGVMFHCEAPEGMRKDQDFPVSIEAQMLGGDGQRPRTTANVCTPGTNLVMGGELVTRHCTSSTSKTYHGDGWVTMELEVRGSGTVRHIMEGVTVLEYEQPQLDPRDPDGKRLLDAGAEKLLKEGYIALQSESHPVEFRKVEVMRLE